MKGIAGNLWEAYKFLLRLYPIRFQEDYGEEMAAVFREGCRDSAKISGWSVCILGLRELRDLPANLIREHWSEIWRKVMKTHTNPEEPLSKSILRGIFSFGIGFTLIYLIYCLVDTFLNSGNTLWQGNSIWNRLYIHPTALAYSFGAAIMGLKYSKRKAWLSALAAFIAYTLFFRIWASTYWAHRNSTPSNLEMLQIPIYFFETITGILVGGVIGLIHQGWKKAGWYALAGVIGFNLGWVVENPISIYLIVHSPYTGNLDHLVVGTTWYYMYFLIPVIIYGGIVGICMGIINAGINKRLLIVDQ